MWENIGGNQNVADGTVLQGLNTGLQINEII